MQTPTKPAFSLVSRSKPASSSSSSPPSSSSSSRRPPSSFSSASSSSTRRWAPYPLTPPSSADRKGKSRAVDPPRVADPEEEDVWRQRYASALRLKLTWEDICTRFSHPSLKDDDEIYLGRPDVPGDDIRIVRDRGALRRLAAPREFGGFANRGRGLDGEEGPETSARLDTPTDQRPPTPDPDGDEIGGWGQGDDFLEPQFERLLQIEQRRGGRDKMLRPIPMDSEDEEDLRRFLADEAERKNTMGDVDEEEEEDIVDFAEDLSFTRRGRRQKTDPPIMDDEAERKKTMGDVDEEEEEDIVDFAEDLSFTRRGRRQKTDPPMMDDEAERKKTMGDVDEEEEEDIVDFAEDLSFTRRGRRQKTNPPLMDDYGGDDDDNDDTLAFFADIDAEGEEEEEEDEDDDGDGDGDGDNEKGRGQEEEDDFFSRSSARDEGTFSIKARRERALEERKRRIDDTLSAAPPPFMLAEGFTWTR